MTTKPAKCKVCKAPFQRTRPLQTVCGYECSIAIAQKHAAKSEKIAKSKAKAERRDDGVRRLAIKTRAEWIKDCQAVANRYARVRDIRAGYGCISCGAPYRGAYGGAFDGGHLRSVGSAPHMRFYLPQIALQCVKCNRYLGGNVIEFRRGLVARRGIEFVERIESMQGEGRWDVEYLKRFKKVISKRANRIEKRISA